MLYSGTTLPGSLQPTPKALATKPIDVIERSEAAVHTDKRLGLNKKTSRRARKSPWAKEHAKQMY